jgi:hypothetical protein
MKNPPFHRTTPLYYFPIAQAQKGKFSPPTKKEKKKRKTLLNSIFFL